MGITPEIVKPEKTFIEKFNDLCFKYAQLEINYKRYQAAGQGGSEKATAIIKQRDDLHSQMIQLTSDELLNTDPAERLALFEEIKNTNNKLLSNSGVREGVLNSNLFVKKVLLKMTEAKEAK